MEREEEIGTRRWRRKGKGEREEEEEDKRGGKEIEEKENME